MSCVFCFSNNHVSHYCDTYQCDEKREEYLRQKKCCFNCLTPFKNTTCLSYNVPNCIFKQKCFICFSRSHYTVFCPDRSEANGFFPPNVDKDLMPRFLSVLTTEEKYLLCLSSPDNFKCVKLKSFKITYKNIISSTDIKKASYSGCDCEYFVAEIARIENNYNYRYGVKLEESIGLSKLTHISFRIQRLEIHKTPFLTSEFFQLLSPKTKILQCGKVEFLQKLTFQEILLKSPYLEEIDIYHTNVKVDCSWPGDLLQFNHAPKLKDVHLKISSDFNFSVKNLATLMKKKYANISLSIVLPEDKDFEKKITEKLSSHFILYNFSFSSLTIFFHDKTYSVVHSMKYELKDV